MPRWTSKSFKMSVGNPDDKPEKKSSLADIGKAVSKARGKDEDNAANRLLKNLYSYLERPKVIHDRSAHRTPGLHASGLYALCPRKDILVAHVLALSEATLVIEKERHTAGNTFTQDLGHALHDWWQNNYLGRAGLMYGVWRCRKCDLQIEGLKPDLCTCGSKSFRYEEYAIHIEEGMDIHGHCDGVVLDIPGDTSSKQRVFELKTKSSSQYPTIHQPERKHIIQVHAYMKGLGLDEAIIVYVNKDKQCSWKVNKGTFIAGKPKVKAFLVPFDTELWDRVEMLVREHHDATERIIEVNEGRADPKVVLNPREFTQVCESKKCSMARACPVKDICFDV